MPFNNSRPAEKKSRYIMLTVICSLAVIIAVVGAFSIRSKRPPVYNLVISRSDSQEQLVSLRVDENELLVLSYTHSADGTPVQSTFRITGEGLQLVEESYSWYGAGLESGSGYQIDSMGEEVIVSGYDRLFKSLPIRVARTVEQNLTIGEQQIKLNRLASGGTLLLMTIAEE